MSIEIWRAAARLRISHHAVPPGDPTKTKVVAKLRRVDASELLYLVVDGTHDVPG
jgi:hypothetical protein